MSTLGERHKCRTASMRSGKRDRSAVSGQQTDVEENGFS